MLRRSVLNLRTPLPTTLDMGKTSWDFIYDEMLLKLFSFVVVNSNVAVIDELGVWMCDTNWELAVRLNEYFGPHYSPTETYSPSLTRRGLVARDVARFLGAVIVEEWQLPRSGALSPIPIPPPDGY